MQMSLTWFGFNPSGWQTIIQQACLKTVEEESEKDKISFFLYQKYVFTFLVIYTIWQQKVMKFSFLKKLIFLIDILTDTCKF